MKKGDVLVSLDKTDAEQAFEKAQTALAQAEADLKRSEPLGCL